MKSHASALILQNFTSPPDAGQMATVQSFTLSYIHQKPTLHLFQSCSLISSHFILEAMSSRAKRGSEADRMKAMEMECRREKEKRETTYEAA